MFLLSERVAEVSHVVQQRSRQLNRFTFISLYEDWNILLVGLFMAAEVVTQSIKGFCKLNVNGC